MRGGEGKGTMASHGRWVAAEEGGGRICTRKNSRKGGGKGGGREFFGDDLGAKKKGGSEVCLSRCLRCGKVRWTVLWEGGERDLVLKERRGGFYLKYLSLGWKKGEPFRGYPLTKKKKNISSNSKREKKRRH